MKQILMMTMALLMTLTVIGCPNENPENTTKTNTDQPDNKIASLQLVIDKANEGDTIDLSQYTIEGSLSANIDKALTINAGGLDFGNAALTVSSDKVELNGIANASVTAAASLGSGSLKISSSSLSSLTIYGGGMHSIYILDVSVDTITIDQSIDSYRDDIVRLVYDASTDFGSIIAKSDTLLYYDGEDAAPAPAIDTSKIKTAHNVNVAANTAFSEVDGTAVAAVKLSDNDSPSLYVLTQTGNTLSETLINQSIAYITENSGLNLVSSDTVISFTDRAVTNQEFRISQRNAKYNIRFDYGADKPFILTNKTNGTEKNFGITGNASPLYSAQVTDSDGNLYFIHHSSKDNRISLVGIRYDGLTKLITGDNNISILQYMLIDPTDDVTVINRQYIRLAMYEKGSTKHLFVLQNQLWDMTHDYNQETETLTYYNPNIICLNVTTTTTGDLTMDAIGKAQIKFDNAYTFAQALTVDDDENLHIGINKFEIKDDAGQIYIDFGDSVVNKYYFKPMQANPDGLSYPPFELQIKNEKSYKDYHINTIYTITKPIANPTLYQILSNYTFGLEIIIIQ